MFFNYRISLEILFLLPNRMCARLHDFVHVHSTKQYINYAHIKRVIKIYINGLLLLRWLDWVTWVTMTMTTDDGETMMETINYTVLMVFR